MDHFPEGFGLIIQKMLEVSPPGTWLAKKNPHFKWEMHHQSSGVSI